MNECDSDSNSLDIDLSVPLVLVIVGASILSYAQWGLIGVGATLIVGGVLAILAPIVLATFVWWCA